LAAMIPIEARKYIPVPISEVTLDWFIIPNEEKSLPADDTVKGDKKPSDKPAQKAEKKGETINVLLVAIHNSTLNKYDEIVKALQLDVGFFEIEIFSTIRAVVGQSITPTMILDMGAKDTKLYIVEYGVVKVSHVINSGSQDITQTISKSLGISLSKAEEIKRRSGIANDAEDEAIKNSKEAIILGLDRVFGEANRALLQYQQKYGKNVGNAILTGGGATMKGLLPVAKKHLEIDVSISDPFSKIEAPAFFEKVLKEVGPGFTAAIGLALRKLQEDA
ncbi:MAG: pilus assembly protein PilM, partial [Candidatus Paceibacteria bacterium]